jgi:hypothetical protein
MLRRDLRAEKENNEQEIPPQLPDGTHWADPRMLHVLRKQNPDVLVACGRLAEKVCLERSPSPLSVLPHPAYRVVTDMLFERAALMPLAQGSEAAIIS